MFLALVIKGNPDWPKTSSDDSVEVTAVNNENCTLSEVSLYMSKQQGIVNFFSQTVYW